MYFSFSELQMTARDMAREFARKVLPLEVARTIDETEEMPGNVVGELRTSGLLSVIVPEEYNGAGMDYVSYVLIMEEIAKACASTSVFVTVCNSLVAFPIMTYGTPEQKDRFLPRLAAGHIGAFCLSGPGHGSRARDENTKFRIEGDTVVINGGKVFASCSTLADFFLIFAKQEGSDHRGMRAIIVERDTPGFEMRHEPKMGIKASGSCSLTISDVRVPLANVFGDGKTHGFKIAMSAIDCGRIGIAAQAIGIAEAAYDKALAYSRVRLVDEMPISDLGVIQSKLARMAMSIKAARLLTYHAATLKDEGKSITEAAAMAKLYASEMAQDVTYEAVQILGGSGYMRECDVERHERDARITTIYEGTSEIQEIVIARAQLKAATA